MAPLYIVEKKTELSAGGMPLQVKKFGITQDSTQQILSPQRKQKYGNRRSKQ